jgi:hypothetical protein
MVERSMFAKSAAQPETAVRQIHFKSTETQRKET